MPRLRVIVKRRPSSAVVHPSASHGSVACVSGLIRTSLAWVRLETRSVVVSRAACRLKLRGSVRTETSSSPPRGTAWLEPADAAGGVERQPATARAVATAIEMTRRLAFARLVDGCLACLAKSCPTGQETGRSKLSARKAFGVDSACKMGCRHDILPAVGQLVGRTARGSAYRTRRHSDSNRHLDNDLRLNAAFQGPAGTGRALMVPVRRTVMPAAERESESSFVPVIGRSVSLDHAAELLGVSRRTIYNRIREGRLQTVRTLGGSQRVLLDSVQTAATSGTPRPAVRMSNQSVGRWSRT